ncbi:glycoside hydrolase family 16 protein [Acidocella sp.]|uniref:glycoside hydrolase family 16 protein n=1 Tax=Acidocella sp. TaxID=50710 RepID=UPI002630B25D|nr:glycoside hydrolase family 16 protein [Acidocella sp.]
MTFLTATVLGALALSGKAVPGTVGVGAAPVLDLSGYRISFDDEFKKFDISAQGPDRVWTAHTPWNGDFGDATFGNPGPGGPFSLTAQGLAITATRQPNGKWVSGLICSVNKDGSGQVGFSQQYGYFEMKAMLPSGPGTWPAFWLIGKDKSSYAAEIDVIEYYGGFTKYFHTTEHVWVNGKNKLLRTKMVKVPGGSLSSSYNKFGVLITPETTSFYLNRHEYWRTPTPPEYRQPMYILANLALGGGWSVDGLISPQVMRIAYIKVYQKLPAP